MDKEIISVCLTGAAGQISYSFIPLLMTGQVFRNKKIALKLLDIPVMLNTLKGIEMEILDGAYPLLHSIEIGCDPLILFKDVEVVVFLGGYPRKPGMERKDLLAINGKIFKEQAEALNSVGHKNVKCLVVANPANTNCNILSTYAHKIPKKNFTCLTRLDQNRAYAQLSIKTNRPVDEFQDLIIWGNHSITQYPCTESAKFNGEPLNSDLVEYLRGEFIQKIQRRGQEVMEARNNSSIFSAANAVKDHLKDWCYGTGDRLNSMGVPSDGSYGVPQGLIFSFGLILKGNYQYEIKQDLKLSDFAKEKLSITISELIDEEKDAGISR